MRRAALVVLSAALACGGFVVTVGEGDIPPVVIDRTYLLGVPDLPACPAGDYAVTEAGTGVSRTLTVTSAEGSCDLAVVEPAVPVLDAAEAVRAQQALQGRDVTVRHGVLILEDYSLEDENGDPVSLGDRLASATILVDGRRVLGADELRRLDQGPVVVELPDGPLGRLANAVKTGQAVSLKVEARFAFPDAELSRIPQALHLRLTLQPEIELGVPLF